MLLSKIFTNPDSGVSLRRKFFGVLFLFFISPSIYGQVTLPYEQSFEEVADATYSANQSAIPEMEEWSYEQTTENGILSIGKYIGNTTQALALGRSSSTTTSNYATLTLDMSGYDESTDAVLLDFNFSYLYSVDYAHDRVYVRGSDTDDWIEVYNWVENKGENNEWIHVNTLALSSALVANSQSFSSTFQVRFGERETYNSRFFYLDDVSVYMAPEHDIKVSGLMVPEASATLGTEESLTVQFENIGSSTETSIPFTVWVDGPNGRQEFSETATTSLVSGDNSTYSFATGLDLSAVGNYEVTVFSTLTGDERQSNDTLRANTAKQSVYSAGLPYFEDFEATTDTVYVGSQGELVGLAGWSYSPNADNGRLTLGASTNSSGVAMALGRSSSYGHDHAILTIDMNEYSGVDDDILIDFSFSQRYASNSTENRVHIRGSESDEWIMFYDWYANKGADNEWITVNAYSLADSLSAHDQDFSSTFQIRFGEQGFSSDAFYLDDVKVYERPAHDLAAVDLEIPASSPLLGVAEQITVQYVNQGVSTETSIPLTIWIDGPSGRQEVSETATASLATGDTLTYTFTADIDFSEAGNYGVTAFSELTGDLIQSNDTLRSMTRKISSYTDGLPYLVDFNNVSDTVYTGYQGALVDLEGWSYSSNADNGRLTLGESTNSSGIAMALGRSSSYGNATNHAILTIDMNEYSAVDDDILIDFRFSQRYESSYTEDRVHIRGSASDEWIMFYDWSANKGADNEWITVNAYSLADSLSANDQDFSSTFQIRFGEREYSSDAFYLDDVKVYERLAHDLRIVNLELPEGSSQLTAVEEVTVQYVNLGSSTETSVPLTAWIDGPSGRQEVSESATTSLATGDTLTYTFTADIDFSEAGNYGVTAFSELTGDLIQSNDTLRSMTRKISSYTDGLPYLVDFNNLPDTVYTGYQGALVDLEGWSYTSNADNGRLTLGASTNSSGVAMGLGRSSSYGNATNHAILTIDMNEYSAVDDDILIDFRFSQRYESSYTEDRVHIRGSASDEWIMFYDWSANKGADNEWITVNAYSLADSLSANDQDFSSTFQIRFGEREYSSDAFYLDDVKVYERPAHDLAVVDLEVPASSALLGATEQITVQYVNQGVSTETSVPLTVWIDGPSGRQEVSETSTTSLATGDTLTYTFTADMDFSEAGNYEVTVFSELSGDLVQSNDTLRHQLFKRYMHVGLPYQENFEESDGGWVTGGKSSSWAWGTMASANKGWATNLLGNYNNGELSYVESPVFDLSEVTSSVVVSFDLKYNMETNYDFAWLEVSNDGGSSFSRLEGAYMEYTSNNRWNGVGEVEVSSFPIEEFSEKSNVVFRVIFDSDGSAVRSGIELNTFSLNLALDHDLYGLEIEEIIPSPTLGEENVSISYINFGMSTETSIPLTIWIDGPSGRQEVSETATASLATGDTLTYTFVSGLDFSAVGNYEVTGFSTLDTDLNYVNDTLRSTTRKVSSYTDGLPYLVDFNNVSDTVYTGEQAALVDLEGWSYSSNADNGRLTLGASTNSSGVAMALGRSSSYGNATNHAILTIDMNEYSAVDDDILIDFRFSQRYESSYTEDRVHIRGSASDEWIMFYDWSANKGADNEWVTVNAYSLEDSLSANDQDFSSTFQIRFGEREYSTDAFYLDDVKVYERPAHDLAAVDLEISASSPLLGATEQITVQYVNQGVSTETSVPLTVWIDGPSGRQEVNETATTSLATGDTLTYTFTAEMDFSEVGNYDLTVFSELSGDLVQSNDTLRANTAKQSVYSAGLPYFEDFESITDTVYVGSQGGLEGLSGWSFVPDTDNGNVSIGTYSGNETRAMKLAREESIYEFTVNLAVLTLDLNDISVATDDLLLDFDFSQNSAYPYAENKVYVRGSASDDWIILYDWYANAGNNYEWIVVNSLAVSDTLAANDQDFSATFQLRFGEKEDYASDAFLLDNVHVYERPAHDLAAIDLEIPASSPLLGATEQITVQYVNQGVSTETSVPLTVWIDGPSGRQEVSETAAISLATGDTLTYTFSADMGFSEAGNYEVTVFSELSGDLVQSNDTLRASATKQSVYSAGLPYFEDFESITDTVYVGSQGGLEGLSGWSFVPDTDNGNVSIGTYSGNETRAMKLAREESIYEFTVNLAVLTLDLSDKSVATDDLLLDFDFSQNSAYPYAENKVYVRGSASDDWIILYDWYANAGNNYEWIVVNSLAVSDTLAANDQDFSATFQLRFGEKEDYASDAFLLDNVHVYERPAHELAVVDLEVPASSALLGATEQIVVQYVNQGVSTETSVPLTVWIDGPSGRQEVSETAAISLATGDTLTYTFSADMDFSEAGNYEVTVFSELSGDLVQSNDTLRGYLIKPSIYNGGLPYLADFDLLADTVYAQNQGELIGLPGWSYENSSEYGRLSIGQFSQNETQAMSMYRSESNTTSNFAVLTMDMSTYDASTDKLLLDFRFSYRYSGVYAHNRVFIRGSETDDWIEFYDWHENRGGNNEWVDVNTLPLTDSLVAHDQNFSSTFQVRFGERDTYNSRYFYLDDVKVRERPAHDLAAVDLEIPASSPLLGVAEQIAVQYVNQGVSTETSVPLTVWIDGPSGRQEVSETAATSLATGDTLTYTFSADMDFSEVGNYEVTVFSELTGDLIQSNDTLRSMTRKISSYTDGLPYLVDFNNLPDTVYTGYQGALVDLEGWSYTSNADNGRLTLGASTNSSGVAMALGRSSSYGNAINHAILTIDMNEYSAVDDDILIDFRFSQRYESSYTEDRVHIRGSASDEWIMLYDWSANKGATNEWITVNAYSLADSLSAHDQDFSSTFQIRFGEREYGTDAFYLDDIKVYQRYAHDMTATGLTVPEASVQLTATESITVELVNDGSSTETSVPLVAWIDGPNGRQEVAETASVSMAYDGTTSYTFESLVDLSAPGNYSFTVFSELTGEANVMNDTIRSSTEHYSVYTGELPYLADFESVEEAIYTTNQGELSGLSGWSYTIDNGSGLLSIGSHDANDTRSLQLTGSEDALNQARFTINLSQYDVANDEILFDIDFAMGADVSASQNKIFIRGSEDDEWIVFYDWGLNGTAGEFVEVRGLPIAQLLADNDQNFSATFQFRLDQMSTSNEFNLTVDNMSIYELPGLNARAAAVVASTGTEAYIGLGSNGTKFFNDFWKTDAENEFSIQLAEYPGVARDNAVSFMIGDLLYVGTGSGEDDTELSDFYVYDPAVDTWSTIADFGGGARTNAVGFALDGYGYVGTGYGSGDEQSDFWKYDPVTDTWIEVAGLGVDKRQSAFAFVIDGKAYVGGGLFYDDYSVQLSDIKAYDPSTDVWIEKIDADGINLSVNNAATFTAYGKGYITYGNKEKIVSYDPVTNEVENLGDFLEFGETRVDPVAFMLGDQPYFGLGYYGFFETVYSDEVVPLTGFNFAPVDIFLSAESMSENNAIDALIGTLTVEDPSDENSHTYSLVSDGVHDSNNDQVYILGSNLYAENSFDYETQSVIQFYLKVTDSHGASFAKAFELNVLDENEQPSSIQISSAVVEESPTGESLFVGVFTVLDDDVSDTHVYSILTGDTPFTVKDDSLFVTAPDFETQTSYELSIQATDAGDLTVNAQFEITILDVNEAMTEVEFDSDSFAEDLLVNDYVGSFTVVDPDANETFTYSFVEDSELGADNDSFYINTGDLFLSSRFNFEEQSEANILVRVTDNGGHFVDLAIVLTVTDANDLITDIVFIQTYTPISTIIPGQTELGHVEFSDEDLEDSYSYQIISANRDLSINAEGVVAANSNFSFFSGESMTFTVEVTDASGELFQQEFSIASGDLVLGTGTKNLLIEMYPNPVLSQLTISAPEADRLEVYTLTGVLVRDEQIGGQTVQLDCSALQAGVYLVRLYDGNQYSTYRLIKE